VTFLSAAGVLSAAALLPAAALCFTLSLVAAGIYLPLARRMQQLDTPNHRSAHGRPTPSSGGIAVVAALLLALALLQAFGTLEFPRVAWTVLLAVGLLCAVGAVDDRRSLPVAFRLAAFFALAGLVVWLYVPAPDNPAPSLFLHVLLILLLTVSLVGVINAVNFMDGIDGLAALQTVAVALTLVAVAALCGSSRTYVLVALAIASVHLAFLLFNWQPARLFMGDAGSLSAGMLLGWLGLWGAFVEGINPLLWLLPMSPFLLDSGVTLVQRFRRGERLAEAHNSHCYQRLARRWGSHQRVVLGLLALHLLWLLPLALLAGSRGLSPELALLLALLPQTVFMAKSAAFE
jgi:Fuc2NAc and GlcNAc transferase